jgi:acyl-CoA dehydrogenase
MSWDFETDAEFQEQLGWIREFVADEIDPLEYIVPHPYDVADPVRQELIPPLQEKVKARGLWACHLGPNLGGPGYGQVKLALMNELFGRTAAGPVVFGCQAPDSGNAEILAHFGTPELKKKFLEPLIDGRLVSCFSMTEPQGGTDPTQFKTSAVRDGDEWVINGEKWFSSHARQASFLISMVVTDPDNPPHQRLSSIVVPTDTPGLEFVRQTGIYGEDDGEGNHPYLRYNDVRVPLDHLLGERGGGFVVAQTRLGGGRIHHAMRTVARIKWAFDTMCERAISRTTTRGENLGRQQLVQEMIAESWAEIEQFRLLVLQTAWKIDRYNDYKRVRADISAVKMLMPKVYNNVISRALQVHGSLGLSNEMPFGALLIDSYHVGLADGATEIHKVTAARQLMSQYKPSTELFPSYHLPSVKAAARARYADVLEKYGR